MVSQTRLHDAGSFYAAFLRRSVSMPRFFVKAQDPVSCWTHALGAAAAFAGGLICLLRALVVGTPGLALSSALCFCVSMVALYSASAIYHYYPGDVNSTGVKRILRKIQNHMFNSSMCSRNKSLFSLRIPTDNRCLIANAGKIIISVAATFIDVAGTDARFNMICLKTIGQITDFYIIGNTARSRQNKYLPFCINFAQVTISGW